MDTTRDTEAYQQDKPRMARVNVHKLLDSLERAKLHRREAKSLSLNSIRNNRPFILDFAYQKL